MELQDIFSLQNGILLLPIPLLALYFYYRKKYSFWTSKGIPQTKTRFIFGSSMDFLLEPFHEVEHKRYRKYGRIYGSYEGVKPTLTVADPELIKAIMVKDFHIFPFRRDISTGNKITDKLLTITRGEDWKRVRNIVSPSFTSGKLRKMAQLVNDSAQLLVKNFMELTGSNSSIDCKKYFGAFTMDTITRCAFGIKINSQEEEDNPFVAHARKLFSRNNRFTIIVLFFFPWLNKLLRMSFLPKDVLTFFIKNSNDIIRQRKEKGEKGNDFLQLIMDSRDEAQEQERHNDVGNDEIVTTNKVLSADEAIAQCLLFFLVGYDTTASTLTFTAYNLALNPECQNKLIEEVDQVWEKHNGNIDFDVVSDMQYLDAVICESLRLFAVLTRAERTAVEDYVLGDTGITIPKGTVVGIPLYAMHRDPEYYPEPEKFDPERFSPENKENRNPYIYLPFGAGPRNCIGMRFALMEAKLCLVQVLRHIRFVRSPETKVPPDYYLGQGFLQPKNIFLKVERRNVAS